MDDKIQFHLISMKHHPINAYIARFVQGSPIEAIMKKTKYGRASIYRFARIYKQLGYVPQDGRKNRRIYKKV